MIFRNISELNKLVAENVRTVDYVENGAKFLPTNVMHLTFYADGIRLDDGRFRPFTERGTKSFMKDLTDGFFPSELQVSFSVLYHSVEITKKNFLALRFYVKSILQALNFDFMIVLHFLKAEIY